MIRHHREFDAIVVERLGRSKRKVFQFNFAAFGKKRSHDDAGTLFGDGAL